MFVILPRSTMKREAVTVILLLCSLAFWCQQAKAGVTFLSPSQKPLVKKKLSFILRHMKCHQHASTDDSLWLTRKRLEHFLFAIPLTQRRNIITN